MDKFDLLVPQQAAEQLKTASLSFTSLSLNTRQRNDLEMLLTGGFQPLRGFLGEADYDSVVQHARLTNGMLWPIPVNLDVSETLAAELQSGQQLALRDGEGLLLAVLTVSEIWKPDLQREASLVFGSEDPAHPGVARLLNDTGPYYIAGEISGIQTPLHYSFTALWKTPDEVRAHIKNNQWQRTLAFQTSRVIHRVHRNLLISKAREYDAKLLLHPTLGQTRQGDIAAASRVHCYQAVLDEFPEQSTLLALCPLAMRQAGPRETLWHALIENNYGASHFLVGPNDSSPRNRQGEAQFYNQYASHDLIQSYQNELAIEAICVEQYNYYPEKKTILPVTALDNTQPQHSFREEQLCAHMQANQPIPEWWSFESVITALQAVYKPRQHQGFTLFFTGLSGSGKSTIANIVNARLIELGSRPVTLLDGDIVRLNLSSELGFSRKDRDLNVRRIGFVANEITKNGGAAICAPIAPYTASRRAVRELIEPNGGFIEVYVSTPLSVCEGRDRKGLYAKARQGIIPEFTGISDPYETPQQAEISIDTTEKDPLACAEQLIGYLFEQGYLDKDRSKQRETKPTRGLK